MAVSSPVRHGLRPKAANGQKKTFPRKGKSSLHKKRKQRTHGKTGRELLVQFGAHRAFLHGAVSFLYLQFLLNILA
jgi:hypothetical protein